MYLWSLIILSLEEEFGISDFSLEISLPNNLRPIAEFSRFFMCVGEIVVVHH